MNAIHSAATMRWSCGTGGACAIQCFHKKRVRSTSRAVKNYLAALKTVAESPLTVE